MKIRHAGFEYQGLNNLGDQIQSIAAERFLPKIDIRFNRDSLSAANIPSKHLLIMNGWFSHDPENCLPTNGNILPVFWGFHISDWNNSWQYFLSDKCLAFFKRFEPIGCRDMFTANKLAQAGINTFYSRCLTLTFPKRDKIPVDGLDIVVDVPVALPNSIERNCLRLSHNVNRDLKEYDKRLQAKKLLYIYKRYAKRVVTTRLHCALPCIAMGIPVIFFGDPNDYRTSIIEELGLEINKIPAIKTDSICEEVEHPLYSINWNPDPIDIQLKKDGMIQGFAKILATILENH